MMHLRALFILPSRPARDICNYMKDLLTCFLLKKRFLILKPKLIKKYYSQRQTCFQIVSYKNSWLCIFLCYYLLRGAPLIKLTFLAMGGTLVR